MSRTRIVVTEDGAFDLLLSKEKGKLSTVDEFLALCERMTIIVSTSSAQVLSLMSMCRPTFQRLGASFGSSIQQS